MYCHQCGAKIADTACFCPYCGTKLEHVSPHVPGPTLLDVPAARSQKRDVRGSFQLLWSLLALAGVFFIQVLGVIVAMLFDFDLELVSVGAGAFGAVMMLFVLGGGELVSFSRAKVAWVMRQGLWSVVVSIALVAYESIALLVDGSFVVTDGWPGRICYIALLTFLIGLFEETVFRGILLGGLVARWGSTRRGVIACAIVSSVLFGCAHVEWWSMDVTDPLQIAQAALKIAQTGTYAFFLATMVLCTRELWGVSGIHALNDFLLMFCSIGLLGESLEVSYVSEGSDGMVALVLYVVVTTLYIPLVVKAWRKLRDRDFVPPLLGNRQGG